MRLALIGMGLTALWIGDAAVQSGVPSGFEVASMKPSTAAPGAMHVGVAPGGAFTAQGITLKELIQQAYELRDFQISGGPAWLDKDTYDIVAKASGMSVSDDQIRQMTTSERDQFRQQMMSKLRILLADRFQLKAHQEERELAIYALIGAKNGPRIQAATDGGGSRPGLSTRRGEAGIEITGRAASITSLVKALSNQLDRFVLNKTGLNGTYDFKLTFSPDPAPRPPDSRERGDDASSRVDTSGPSIFTALQEQLGLKLQAERGPVPVLIIDDARKVLGN